MATRRPSKAAIRRAVAHQQEEQAPPPPLPPAIEDYVTAYRPRSLSPEHWEAIQPLVLDVLARSAPTGKEAAKQRLVALTRYVGWCQERGYPLERSTILDCELVEAFSASVADAGNATAAASYRERLRAIVGTVNPTGSGPAVRVSIPHRAVKPPYTATEIAAIVRIARTQPHETTARQLRACVGLGLGAGLDSVDLRDLRVRDITDQGPDGVRIDVRGPRRRRVWVLEEYEELVRAGTLGVGRSRMVVGGAQGRRHVASKVFEQAVILGDAPRFEQSRMRSTWLARLLCSRVPLPVIMQAAGLTSARTITDLVPLLDATSADEAQLLRGGR